MLLMCLQGTTGRGDFTVVELEPYKQVVYKLYISNRPVLQLPAPEKSTVVVKCCPVPFELVLPLESSLSRQVTIRSSSSLHLHCHSLTTGYNWTSHSSENIKLGLNSTTAEISKIKSLIL